MSPTHEHEVSLLRALSHLPVLFKMTTQVDATSRKMMTPFI